jgi:hypothetical protein
VGINDTQLQLRWGGDSQYTGSLAVNETHLILGKLTVGSGNDLIEVWADPANLSSLGTPLLSGSSYDLGDSLTMVGFGGINPNFKLDALRFSDGANAFADVTGVPEPATLALLATGLVGLLAHAWRKRR